MRAITITKHGPASVLAVHESDDPKPKPGEVRVRVKACGLNFAEVMARQGLYPDAPKPPCVVGYEAAGEIDALGEGVTAHETGDRVMIVKNFGCHADTVCVPAEQAITIPKAMSFEDAAAIPVNYLTAYHMLFNVAHIKPGDNILIHMAAGGVGTAALQLAKTVDDVTTFGTASASKHDYIREQGCDHPIDYRTKKYEYEARRLSDFRGMDVVLDPLGGWEWRRGYRLLRPNGRLVMYGFSKMVSGGRRNIFRSIWNLLLMPRFEPIKMMNTNRSVSGVHIGRLWSEKDLLRQSLEQVIELYKAKKVRPHVDQTFSFDQAAEAHRYLEERKNTGKVVLVP